MSATGWAPRRTPGSRRGPRRRPPPPRPLGRPGHGAVVAGRVRAARTAADLLGRPADHAVDPGTGRAQRRRLATARSRRPLRTWCAYRAVLEARLAELPRRGRLARPAHRTAGPTGWDRDPPGGPAL